MKISTSINHGMSIGNASASESAVMMRVAGFQGADLGLTEFQMEPNKLLSTEWKQHILERVNALHAEQIDIAQTHLPFYLADVKHPGDGSLSDYMAFMMPSYLRSLETTAEVGCKIAVMHPYYVVESAEKTKYGNMKIIEGMLPTLEKYNLKLALENIWAQGYQDTHMSYPEDMIQVIEDINDSHIGLCIDTGHANLFSIHIGNMARMFGKHLYALHVNGNSGKADSHTVPYSMSDWCENIDYLDFSAALKEIGYHGWYNLEIASGQLPPCVAQPFYNYAAAVGKALADLVD